ncbi:MAG: energy transducer TonB [Bacteroidetes bacterium]|nr:energy transducer TonB [Bacteroidota bacterium]
MKHLLYILTLICITPNALFAQKKKVEIFKYVEGMPEPTFNLNEYLAKNLEYPEEAMQKGIQGRVLVKFIVTEKGTLDSIHTIGPVLGGGLEDEAIRVIKNMPLWKPGKQNGRPVKVYYTQPLSFKLTDDSTSQSVNAAGH